MFRLISKCSCLQKLTLYHLYHTYKKWHIRIRKVFHVAVEVVRMHLAKKGLRSETVPSWNLVVNTKITYTRSQLSNKQYMNEIVSMVTIKLVKICGSFHFGSVCIFLCERKKDSILFVRKEWERDGGKDGKQRERWGFYVMMLVKKNRHYQTSGQITAVKAS